MRLDNEEFLCSLSSAAEDFARAAVPGEAMRPFMLASMTALQKRDGGVRGIATGTSFRRLVAKTLARQFGREVEEACSPFQFALSSKAGVDCVGHAVRVATEADAEATVLSIDGIGAYDHVHRSAMLNKLLDIPSLWGLLPFVRATYCQPTCHKWKDQDGVQHDVHQHEGGEQGNPLMPLMFSLAIHNALVEVKASMRLGEMLFAFLDDVYVVATSQRIREVCNLLNETLAIVGIQLHAGKTRTWNRAGTRPADLEDLGPEEGIKILGTPIGSDQFVADVAQARLEEERRLWEAISWVPDTQCAWQILLQCSGPRCHHFFQTIPPSQSETYVDGHDEGMWRAFEAVMGRLPGDDRQKVMAWSISGLPMRMSGLGLRSARRSAPAAYWASWSDCLSMLQKRLPELTTHIIDQLAVGAGGQGCLGQIVFSKQAAGPEWVRCQTGLDAVEGGVAPSPTRFL